MKNKPIPDYLDQQSIAGMGSRPFRQPPTRSDVFWSVFAAVLGAVAIILSLFL